MTPRQKALAASSPTLLLLAVTVAWNLWDWIKDGGLTSWE